MKTNRLLLALFAASVVALFAQSASAQGINAFGGRFNPYRGNRFGSSPYSLGRIPTPPYFALHPPVYYSGNTYRTYGQSPFARPPYPIFQAPRATVSNIPANAAPTRSVKTLKVVLNPYIDSPSAPIEAPKTRTAKRILNPYYIPANELVTTD